MFDIFIDCKEDRFVLLLTSSTKEMNANTITKIFHNILTIDCQNNCETCLILEMFKIKIPNKH